MYKGIKTEPRILKMSAGERSSQVEKRSKREPFEII